MRRLKVQIFELLGVVVLAFALVIVSLVSANTATGVVGENIDGSNLDQSLLAQKVDTFIKEQYEGSYPSYFGGAYVSDDSRNVVVQIIKENIPEDRSVYEKVVNMGSALRVKYVDSSYAELNSINERIVAHFESNGALIENWSASYVDVINNVVVVELVDNSKENIEQFKKYVVDSDHIVFIEGKIELYADIKAGQRITVKNNGSCSMGYRVRVGGKAGYITSGHCVDGLNSTIPSGTVKKYQRSGKVDAAFIQTTPSYIPLNNLAYTSGIINSLDSIARPTLAVNTSIAKAGQKTGYTSGQVKSLNYSVNDGGVVFSSLVATTAHSDKGDSGAPVFTTSLVAGGAPLAGVLMGGNT